MKIAIGMNIGDGPKGSGAPPLLLPRVGPYASNAITPVAGLPDLVVDSPIQVNDTQTRTTPLTYNHFDVSWGCGTQMIQPDHGSTGSIFIWANILTLNGFGCCVAVPMIDASGSDGNPEACGGGGGGGSGGSGGGGGAGPFDTPGSGGSGVNGQSTGSSSGGNGWGSVDATGFAYPAGGAGGDGAPIPCTCAGVANGGPGGNGYGGGGGGAPPGAPLCCCVGQGGPGGGGGGGLIVIVANQLLTTNAPVSLTSKGGNGQGGPMGGSGGGGGGSIYVAAKKYDGGITPDVAHGNAGAGANNGADGIAKIFEIHHDGTLGPQRLFSDTWDNS